MIKYSVFLAAIATFIVSGVILIGEGINYMSNTVSAQYLVGKGHYLVAQLVWAVGLCIIFLFAMLVFMLIGRLFNIKYKHYKYNESDALLWFNRRESAIWLRDLFFILFIMPAFFVFIVSGFYLLSIIFTSAVAVSVNIWDIVTVNTISFSILLVVVILLSLAVVIAYVTYVLREIRETK
jgi:hypothetical protein